MPDSLTVAGLVELLGGGVVSDHPLCPGAMFRLARDFSFSAPAVEAGTALNLITGGSVPVTSRYANRTPKIPVFIEVQRSGDSVADRKILAGARELLLKATSSEYWDLTWIREGGSPFILTCIRASQTVVEWSLIRERQLISCLALNFEALPFGRSDQPETIDFQVDSTEWTPPPNPVTIDDFGTSPGNFLTGNAATFESGIANWVGQNESVARSTAQKHSGTASLAATATSAATGYHQHCAAGNILTQGMPVKPGDVIPVSGWYRAQAAPGRLIQPGADWYDAAGTYLFASFISGLTDNATGWVNPSGAVTAPAGAAFARYTGQVGSPPLNEIHYLDDVLLGLPPITSAVDNESWSQSTQRVENSYSAHWSRHSHDHPNYDHTLPAGLNLTGMRRLSIWLGLGTATHHTWHAGSATVEISLYDSTGKQVTVHIHTNVKAAWLVGKPHWQKVSGSLPLSTDFDWTAVSRYTVEVWNHIETGGIRVLQSDAYLNALMATPGSTGAAGPRGKMYRMPGIPGTAPFGISAQLKPGVSVAPTVTEYTTAGSHTFRAPSGCTSVQAEVTGGAGGGCGAYSGDGSGGGGGGEWAMEPAIPTTGDGLTDYIAWVGAAGTAGSPSSGYGGNGGDSYFTGNSGNQVRAHGGFGGGVQPAGHANGGNGGSGSTAYRHFPGGDGGNGRLRDPQNGGGGGGSAGPGGPGRDAEDDDWHGAPAQNGGGPGGNGGKHADTPHAGSASAGLGGGGGGAWDGDSAYAGGAGKPGKVRLTYMSTGAAPLTALILHHPPQDEPPSFAPLVEIGGGGEAPGSTYTAPLTGQLQARYDGTYRLLLIAYTWNTPANARTITLTITQKRPGSTDLTKVITRTFTPSTDKDMNGVPIGTSRIVDLGSVHLPLAELGAGQNNDYFQFTPACTNALDRFSDLLLLAADGETMIWSTAQSGYNNIWVDEPLPGRQLGLILGSASDRDAAASIMSECELWGGPFRGIPGENRFVAYAPQGSPPLRLQITPRWWLDSLV